MEVCEELLQSLEYTTGVSHRSILLVVAEELAPAERDERIMMGRNIDTPENEPPN